MTRKSEDASGSTIRDVAARAGVSASTVSRVLGGDYPLSMATRTHVLRAVRDLDYVADARAHPRHPRVPRAHPHPDSPDEHLLLGTHVVVRNSIAARSQAGSLRRPRPASARST